MKTDLRIKNMLIDEYDRLTRIRKLAEKTGASEVVEEVNRSILFLKLKLQPLELPEE